MPDLISLNELYNLFFQQLQVWKRFRWFFRTPINPDRIVVAFARMLSRCLSNDSVASCTPNLRTAPWLCFTWIYFTCASWHSHVSQALYYTKKLLHITGHSLLLHQELCNTINESQRDRSRSSEVGQGLCITITIYRHAVWHMSMHYN